MSQGKCDGVLDAGLEVKKEIIGSRLLAVTGEPQSYLMHDGTPRAINGNPLQERYGA
jgi:hypothetical protein